MEILCRRYCYWIYFDVEPFSCTSNDVVRSTCSKNNVSYTCTYHDLCESNLPRSHAVTTPGDNFERLVFIVPTLLYCRAYKT